MGWPIYDRRAFKGSRKAQLICGDEEAALTDERKYLIWKAGQRKAAKQQVNRRQRHVERLRLAERARTLELLW